MGRVGGYFFRIMGGFGNIFFNKGVRIPGLLAARSVPQRLARTEPPVSGNTQRTISDSLAIIAGLYGAVDRSYSSRPHEDGM